MSLFDAALDLGSTALKYIANEDAKDAAKDQAKAQSKEVTRSAAANREISLYDASVADLEAFYANQAAAVELSNHMRATDRLLGTATARLGKSGVVVSAGSALESQVKLAFEAGREADLLIHGGRTAEDRRKSAADRYRILADKGLRDAAAHATLIEKAGADAENGYEWAGRGILFEGIYDITEDLGL